jgi:adenylylsulfate kinase
MKTADNNIRWHTSLVSRQQREYLNRHKSAILWFTGLSGAGKSTLAHAVEDKLFQKSCRTFVLDGDNVRHGLCSDLGFAPEDRVENIRRIGEMTKLFPELIIDTDNQLLDDSVTQILDFLHQRGIIN